MSPRRLGSSLPRLLANLLAPGLVVLPSYVAFLQFQGYPLWRPEALAVAGLLLLAGLPFGLLLAWRPRTFGAFAVALVLLLLVTQVFPDAATSSLANWSDLNQGLKDWAGPFGGAAISVVLGVAVLALPFAVLSWLGPNLGLVLTTVFGVAVLSGLLLPAEPPPLGETYRRVAGPPKDLPPIIHIVFDEHIGVEGLPVDIAGGEDLSEALRRFYADFGFTLFGGAYSEYSRTRHSLISLLNGYESLDGRIPDETTELLQAYWDNLWFKTLAERGYLIHTYYINGWDFCGGEDGYAARCTVYSDGSVRVVLNADLTAAAKAEVIFWSYLHSLVPYKLFRVLSGPLGLPAHILPEQPYLHAADSLGVFEQILSEIRAAPRGTSFFAHLLIPHVTHFLDETCHLRPDPMTWTSSGKLDIATGTYNTAASRRARYAQYFVQVRCLHAAFGRFLEGLKEIGVFEDATIIVHGDHGSRIARVVPLTTAPQPLSVEDFADMYSALFAVRTPSQAPGYRSDLVSLQARFAEMFLGLPPREGKPQVHLDYPASIQSKLTKPPFPRRPVLDFRHAPARP